MINKEIKEILDKLKDINNYDISTKCDEKGNELKKEYDIYLSKKEVDKILDYITNLEQKYERMKENAKILSKGCDESQEKIDKTIEYIDKMYFEISYNKGCLRIRLKDTQQGKELLNILKCGDE